MKKIILSTVAAASLLSLSIPSVHAASYPKDAYWPSPATKNPVKVELPNIKSKTVINQMKKGTYAVRGIKLGSPYGYVIKQLGVSKEEMINRSDDYVEVTAAYGNMYISADAEERYASLNDLKVSYLSFNYLPKKIKQKDMIKLLGKADNTEIYGDDTKITDDDFMMNDYGHLNVTFTKQKGLWVLESVSVSPVDESDAGKTLKDRKIKALTDQELLSMKKGTFSFYGVKPGMNHAEVLNLVGESSDDYIYRNGKSVNIIANYGSDNDVTFEYQSNANQEMVLKTMMWANYNQQSKLSALEKIIGKPTKKTYDSYTSEEDGKNVVYKTFQHFYEKHIVVSGEQSNKVWYVNGITYK
ncbi:hypothetical protein [Macrococcus lamae]|uniref:CAP-associated domain-containing protein n=1 Tax=Macrococcus lamae TaxID=198484 RepID=A0A4R6BT17_9STAP|nr:hypothetical protein [Macrococcus lamae]TDM07447.1 hypothetical protein ERX29_08345 [Macrococcus lamae]